MREVIDPNNLAATARLTFNDEFNDLNLWNGVSGTWDTNFWYNSVSGNGSTLSGNGEQEWYVNANYAPTASVKPWSVNNGVLDLTAAPAAPDIQPLINGYKYTSGMINSYHSFSQTYGYFEMKAQLPAGQGFWPAFWLLPEDGSWPPELDVMEVLGNDPTKLYTTVHYGADNQSQSLGSTVADMSGGYHTYGVDWEPDAITWYFDGREVYQTATPADMNKPMYMLANLAVGGYWPGMVDGSTRFPAAMHIDYIRAYAPSGDAGSGGGTTEPGGGGAPTAGDGETIVAPNDSGSALNGGAGDDVLIASHGADALTGGGGADRFVFPAIPWSAGHITDFTPGVDVLDLSGLLQDAGYAGPNPVSDGYLSFTSDGAGSTKVWFDPDGIGSNTPWPYLVTTLDHVSPTSLRLAHDLLFGPGSGGDGGSGGAPQPTIPTLQGGPAADQLFSTAADEIINGGPGVDFASYVHSTGGVTVSLLLQGVSQDTVGAGHDTLISIEKLDGSAFADTLTGDAGANTLFGEDGNDNLYGGSGADNLYGGSGSDILSGGPGDDLLNGGAGIDFASYADAAGGVTVSLGLQGVVQDTGGAGRDTLIGIEKIDGSAFADVLTGDSWSNALFGEAGNDVLYGGDGADKLYGGAGNDILFGGPGDDLLHGGAGQDFASYADAGSGVAVSLALQGAAQDTGGAGHDTLISIEKIDGSAFNDTLSGDSGSNALFGEAGDDTLWGAAGADSLYGGAGNDVIDGGAGQDLLSGGPGSDTFVFDSMAHTTARAPDLITDFGAGDRIDLHVIDADPSAPGVQAFHLGGGGGHPGDIVIVYDAAANRTVLDLYTDVHSVIALTGDHSSLASADFIF